MQEKQADSCHQNALRYLSEQGGQTAAARNPNTPDLPSLNAPWPGGASPSAHVLGIKVKVWEKS